MVTMGRLLSKVFWLSNFWTFILSIFESLKKLSQEKKRECPYTCRDLFSPKTQNQLTLCKAHQGLAILNLQGCKKGRYKLFQFIYINMWKIHMGFPKVARISPHIITICIIPVTMFFQQFVT
jgi:hypothetical protein